VCVRLSGAPPWPTCDSVRDVCVCVCVCVRPSGTPPWPTCDGVGDVCVCVCVRVFVCVSGCLVHLHGLRATALETCVCLCVCVRLSGTPPWLMCDGVGDVCVCVCVCVCVSDRLVCLYGLRATALEARKCACACMHARVCLCFV